MAILLALSSALMYGLSDFIGGFMSRRTSAWPVAVVGQCSAVGCTTILAVFVSGHPTAPDFGWAALGGVGSGLGTIFLYRGLASGQMSVVAPVSAVGTAVLPVLVGTVLGERLALMVWIGIALALPAIWMVSSVPADDLARLDPGSPRSSLAKGLGDGVLAGLGFGLLFAALGAVPSRAGFWPLTLAEAVSVPAIIILATASRAAWVPRRRAGVGWAALTGPLGASATALFLLAAQRGYLSVAGVLAALYPASTVLLAALVLREQIHRVQAAGLALCAVAVALVAGG